MRSLPFGLLLLSSVAFAEGQGVSTPYIDKIRSELPATEQPGSHIGKVKKELEAKDQPSSGSYIDELKKKNPELQKPESPSLLESEKAKLGPKDEGGAIKALHEGKSDLKPRYRGEIHNAFGFRVAASMTRTYTSDGPSFQSMYGAGFAPDITVFYEYQPFRSEWLGNVGIYGSLGASYYNGFGNFKVTSPLLKPWDGTAFSSVSRTKFGFFKIPVTLGLSYRFNLFHFLRPFVVAGPSIISYLESRDDNVSGFKGYSKGLFVSGGVSLLLDWMAPGSSWDQYAENSIRHNYLTIEYTRLTTFSGDVNFSASGISAGVAFEY